MKAKSMLAVFITVIMLTGCGQGAKETSGTDQGEAPADGVEMETIRVWSDNAHEKELRMKQIEAFNETTGKELGINIEYTVYGTKWEDTIKMAAQTNEAPDLFRPNGTFLRNFVDSDYLVAIEELPGFESLLAKYEGQLVTNQHIFDGKTYTLPYNITTYKFVINRDLFDKNGLTEAPKTWDEVREYAKIITENGEGKEYGYALGLQSTWIATSYVSRHSGQDLGHIGFNNDTLKFEYSLLAPKMEVMAGMVADGSILPGSAGMDADVMRAQFAEGRVGMLAAVSFDTGVYNEQFPAKCNWEVVEIPTVLAGAAPYKQFVDATSLLAVGKAAAETPERAEKVLKVLEFFYSDENAAEMYEQSLYIPFRQEAIDMAANEPEAKGFADFANVPNKVQMLPMPDTMITVEGKSMQDTIIGILSENPDQDPVTALTDLDERYNAALKEQVDAETLNTFKTPEGRNINAGE
jgi:multiple sugar transport system substrate-binding protein